MKYINPAFINNFFSDLNTIGIDYVLIKNIGNELPDHLREGKDIDIIVHKNSMSAFHSYIKMHAMKMLHPWGKESGWKNIYKLPEFEFWRINIADDLFIDVSNMLCCRSLMPKIWLPLDNHIQEDMWKNRFIDNDNNWWCIDHNILFVYLIVRCILDKQCFSETYCLEIEKVKKQIDVKIVHSYFEFVFFKFTDRLMEMLDNKDYNNIINGYLKFKGY